MRDSSHLAAAGHAVLPMSSACPVLSGTTSSTASSAARAAAAWARLIGQGHAIVAPTVDQQLGDAEGQPLPR